jgi:hypothetical protein
MGEASHSRGGGPSETAVDAAEEAGATCGTTVEVGAARGAAVGAARGKNPGRTVGAGRGATSGSNPKGTSGAGWQGATIPAMLDYSIRGPLAPSISPGFYGWTGRGGAV